MAIHHIDEHLNCYNYSRSEVPVEVVKARKGIRLSKDIKETELLCVVSGKLKLTAQSVKERTIEEGHILLLTPNMRASAEVLEDSYLIAFLINKSIQICDCCPLESLSENIPEKAATFYEFSVLKFDKHIADYFDCLKNCIDEGLKCVHYLDLKFRELMLIMRGFYTREELAVFFRPLISNDTGFSDFIFRNYRKVKTIEELARLSNYSRSGFKAHFRKTFGMSTSAWLREKKAHNIHHELTSGNKSLLDISKEYNFSSVSHMSIFCKDYFGMPPGKIRKESGKKSSIVHKFEPIQDAEELQPPAFKIDIIE